MHLSPLAAKAAVRSTVVVLLLIYCLVCISLVWEFCVCLYFIVHYFCVLSSFAIILKRKRELVALRLLSYVCLVTVNVL